MIGRRVVFGAVLIAATSVGAQVEEPTTWRRTFGNQGTDTARRIVEAEPGTMVVLGNQNATQRLRREGFRPGQNDAWLFKLDASGRLLWEHAYGGEGNDWSRQLIKTGDGGYVVAGQSWQVGSTGQTTVVDGYELPAPKGASAWVIRLDSSGRAIWNHTYPKTRYTGAVDVIETRNGTLVVLAETSTLDPDSSDVWIFELDGEGKLVWQTKYGTDRDDAGGGIVEATDGGLIIVGNSDQGWGRDSTWIRKLKADGKLDWHREFKLSDEDLSGDAARDIIATADGGFLVAGSAAMRRAGETAWIRKYDAAGGLLWSHTYEGGGEDQILAITEDRKGGFAVAGDATPDGQRHDPVGWIMGIDGSGRKLWSRKLVGHLEGITDMQNGGFAVAGEVSIGTQEDALVARLGPRGRLDQAGAVMEPSAVFLRELERDSSWSLATYTDPGGLFETPVPRDWQAQREEGWTDQNTVYLRETILAPSGAHRAKLGGYLSEGIRIVFRSPPHSRVWSMSEVDEWAPTYIQKLLARHPGFAVTATAVVELGSQRALQYRVAGGGPEIPEPEENYFFVVANERYRMVLNLVSPRSKIQNLERLRDSLVRDFELLQ